MQMKTGRVRSAMMAAALMVPMLAPMWAMPALAQHHNDQFSRGVSRGGRGGDYGHEAYRHEDNQRHDVRGGYYQNGQYHPNGIGPGKGAAIGGVGGAVLGAVFGGGLKGALIGGAAGAGIGAIAGKAHQDDQKRAHYERGYPR